jgi:hypothetical protein
LEGVAGVVGVVGVKLVDSFPGLPQYLKPNAGIVH